MMRLHESSLRQRRLILTLALSCLTVSLGDFVCWSVDDQEAISANIQGDRAVEKDADDDWRSVLAWFGPDGDAADEQLAAVAFRFRAAGFHCTLSIHLGVCCVAVKPRDLTAARKLAVRIIDDQTFAWVKTHLVHDVRTENP